MFVGRATVMLIPAEYLDHLRNAGLLVSEPFVPHHRSFPNGYAIGKPQAVGGNAIPGFEAYWGDDDIQVDAPAVMLHAEAGRWIVTAHENIPDPGSGDFVHVFATPDEAIADILDFFFGDSARMDAYRQAWSR
jgi:hypothetical protein